MKLSGKLILMITCGFTLIALLFYAQRNEFKGNESMIVEGIEVIRDRHSEIDNEISTYLTLSDNDRWFKLKCFNNEQTCQSLNIGDKVQAKFEGGYLFDIVKDGGQNYGF